MVFYAMFALGAYHLGRKVQDKKHIKRTYVAKRTYNGQKERKDKGQTHAKGNYPKKRKARTLTVCVCGKMTHSAKSNNLNCPVYLLKKSKK